MLLMAGHAERLQIVEVMRARELGVFAGARHDVVDLEPSDSLRCSPGAHRGEIAAVRRMLRSGRPLRSGRTAASAAIAIAPFDGAARHRPPVIGPERLTTPVAAP